MKGEREKGETSVADAVHATPFCEFKLRQKSIAAKGRLLPALEGESAEVCSGREKGRRGGG